MARKLKSDRILFLTTLVLVCLSVVMVYSASAKDPNNYLIKQGMWAALGVALLSVVMRVDYRTYREPAFIWSIVGLVTVGLIAVLFMPARNRASRWFLIGGLGIQPSEPAKLAVIIFIAALLERRMQRINEPYALVPVAALVLGWIGLILIEPDLGTSVAIVLIAGAMLFAAGLSYKYVLAIGGLAAVPAVALLVMFSGYRLQRFLAFLDPYQDAQGAGYQILQSFIAVGTGGIKGRGLMNGVQKLFYLPEAQTDFIYAVIAEELGLIGATIVLIGFCVITWRGLRIALRAPDKFGAFLAIGLTTMVVVQAFVNMSVVLGLVPTKGIPLPFVSFGGSSLLINLLGMGVLLNVSQHATSEA